MRRDVRKFRESPRPSSGVTAGILDQVVDVVRGWGGQLPSASPLSEAPPAAVVAQPDSRLAPGAVVAVCSAAFAIESVHNDFVYRVPLKDWKRRPTQIQRIGYGLKTGWWLDDKYASILVNRIGDLFRRRGDAVHAYPETLPARPHLAGLNSGAEHELFNAVTAQEAIDLALEVVALTATDPSLDLAPPYDRWLRRWVEVRKPHHGQVQDMQSRRDRVPLGLPKGPG